MMPILLPSAAPAAPQPTACTGGEAAESEAGDQGGGRDFLGWLGAVLVSAAQIQAVPPAGVPTTGEATPSNAARGAPTPAGPPGPGEPSDATEPSGGADLSIVMVQLLAANVSPLAVPASMPPPDVGPQQEPLQGAATAIFAETQAQTILARASTIVGQADAVVPASSTAEALPANARAIASRPERIGFDLRAAAADLAQSDTPAQPPAQPSTAGQRIGQRDPDGTPALAAANTTEKHSATSDAESTVDPSLATETTPFLIHPLFAGRQKALRVAQETIPPETIRAADADLPSPLPRPSPAPFSTGSTEPGLLGLTNPSSTISPEVVAIVPRMARGTDGSSPWLSWSEIVPQQVEIDTDGVVKTAPAAAPSPVLHAEAGRNDGERPRPERDSTPGAATSVAARTEPAIPLREFAAPRFEHETPKEPLSPTGLDRILSGARVSVSQGGMEVRLRLHPESLGEVRVQVRWEGGVLSARLETDSAAARDALQAAVPRLQSALREQGITVEHLSVNVRMDFDTRSNAQPFAFREPPSTERRGTPAEEARVAESEPVSAPAGRLDIRI